MKWIASSTFLTKKGGFFDQLPVSLTTEGKSSEILKRASVLYYNEGYICASKKHT
jgi:hypothetical protein